MWFFKRRESRHSYPDLGFCSCVCIYCARQEAHRANTQGTFVHVEYEWAASLRSSWCKRDDPHGTCTEPTGVPSAKSGNPEVWMHVCAWCGVDYDASRHSCQS